MLRGHDGWELTVAFSPDGARLASGSYDYTARVWDASTGELLHILPVHHPHGWSSHRKLASAPADCADGRSRRVLSFSVINSREILAVAAAFRRLVQQSAWALATVTWMLADADCLGSATWKGRTVMTA